MRKMLAIALFSAALAALAVTAAEATDLRSWDQKLPANKRFIVLSAFDDAAVLDQETQLVWTRQPEYGPAHYATAFASCGLATTGGRRGWRLPSLHELLSLLDGGPVPAIPGTAFQNISGYFWSSTVDGQIGYRQTVSLTGPQIYNWGATLESATYPSTLCVRGHGAQP